MVRLVKVDIDDLRMLAAMTIARYVPRRVARFCEGPRLRAEARPLDEPTETFEGAILFADIKGFTPLTERLARQGPAGAEELAGILNAYFGRLIGAIEAAGGDVLTIAGDAVLALWVWPDLAEAVQDAARAALELQASLADYSPAPDLELATRIALGAGTLQGEHVGLGTDRSCYLVSGSSLEQMTRVDHVISAGQVGVSAEVWSLLGERARGEACGAAVFRLDGLAADPPPNPVREGPPLIAAAVGPYLIETLRSRLEAGQDTWLAELRRLTVMFVNLGGGEAKTGLGQTFALIQKVFDKHGVGIYQFLVDDKGTVLVGVLGLPPWTHDKDAAHGLNAAVALLEALRDEGLQGSIGLASGRVFCGTVGTETRREFTIVGDTMNMSARLMQAAGAGHILCDQTTARLAAPALTCESLPPIAVKGKASKVPVFRPVAPRSGEVSAAPSVVPLVGRNRERSAFSEALQNLEAGVGSVVIVESDPGMGKSVLLDDLRAQARSRGVAMVSSSAVPEGQTTPYHAWRGVIAGLLQMDPLADLAEQQRSVVAQLSDFRDRTPLLNDVLGWDLPETPLTNGLEGRERASATCELLTAFFIRAAKDRSYLLLLDDVQWFDNASWDLLWALCKNAKNMHPCCLALGSRPWRREAPPVYASVQGLPIVRRFVLNGLDEADVAELLAQLLGKAAPAELTAFVVARAAGNPFFVGELLRELQDRGALRDGWFSPPHGLVLPDTLEGILTSRIDRLAAEPALTLKTASVIGRSFTVRMLTDLHPIPSDRASVPEHLQILSGWDLAHPEATKAAWIFKHVITQEVAYNLLPFDRRRYLHQGVATWLEQTYAPELGPWAAELAHHWVAAERPDRAAPYRARAGELAVRAGQWREGIVHLVQAHRDAHTERLLGEATLGLGDVSASLLHFSESVALLGHARPKSRASLLGSLLAQVFKQALCWLRRPSPATGPNRAPLRDAALAAERLTQLCFHDQDLPGSLYWTLAGLSWSERLGPSPELARACGLAGVAAGILQLSRLADHYGRRGLAIARQLNDPSSVGFVSLVVGLERTASGRLQEATVALEEAVAIFRSQGQRRRWEEAAASLAGAYRHQGRIEQADALYRETYSSSLQTENVQARAWGLAGALEASLARGTPTDLLEESGVWFANEQLGRMDRIALAGAVAHAHLLRDDLAEAARWAREVRQLAAISQPTGFVSYTGYAGAAEAMLTCWAQGQAGWDEARLALRDLQSFASVFPLAGARLWLLRGELESRRGHPREAERAWRRSLQEARSLGMPWEQARASRALAAYPFF